MNDGLKCWNDHEQSFLKSWNDLERWFKKLERPGTMI